MQRVSVIGISGSGKSTIASRLAEILGCPRYELDALYFLPGWKPRDEAEFDGIVEEIAAGERWVVDGSYKAWTAEGPIWKRADTVVWPRLPRTVVMTQLVRRSLRRVFTREELWNGNRETLRKLLDPRDSILVDVWSRYRRYNREFEQLRCDPRFAHIEFVVLESRAEVSRWLDETAAREQSRRAR